MSGSTKRWGRAAASGALLGLAIFGAELAFILKAGAVGLHMDVSGPLAALFAVVRPALPSLLGRVAVAYASFGAVAGLLAALLARTWGLERRWARGAVFVGEWLALVALLGWARAVARPALFDDVLPSRLLRELVDHGQPWHARAAALGWLALHLAWSARRWRPLLARAAPVALGLVGLAVAAVEVPAPGAKAPLVVLIGIDAFRPDRLSAFGGAGDVAPNLEAFAREATNFTRAYTPIAQTQPAWRGLLTARWPHHTGVRYPLTPEAHWQTGLPTFAKALGDAGFQSEFWTDCSRFNYQGPAAGFAVSHEPPRGAINFLLDKLRFRGLGMWANNEAGAQWLPEFVDNRALAGIHDPISYAHRLASDWVDTARRGPALLAFHATAAHFPGDPVYPFYRKFVSPSEPLERRLRMTFEPISSGSGGKGGGSRAAAEGLYDELLSQADAQVAILFAALREAGLYDEATIAVFSDHGESFHADTPELEGATPVHGARLSEEENHILLLIKPPKGRFDRQPARVDALVRLIDIGPTLLDVSNVGALPGADGTSLVPLLRGDALAPLRLYAETGFTHAAPDAFDPEHLAEAPRSFDAYRVRPDGAIEMTEAAHQAILREKDIGAFDGDSWVIRSPRRDGSTSVTCRGACPADALAAWLDAVR